MSINSKFLAVFAAALFAACASDAPEPSASAVRSPVAPDTDAVAVEFGPGIQRLADLATGDLGRRLGVARSEIRIRDAEFVTWPDSSLGCPMPGYHYMQVLTNGARIRLEARDSVYHYHSGPNRAPFWCEQPSKIEPAPYRPDES